MSRSLALVLVLGISVLIGVVGCGDKKEAAPSPELSAEFKAARKTFETNCSRCHTLGLVPGEMKRIAPDLSKVAAPPERNRDWILKYIRDPRSQKPDSKMPKFGDKLSADELGALADYLATLK